MDVRSAESTFGSGGTLYQYDPTFYMIVLAILGPLVFGIAVFDGFQHTLTVWIARYLNIFYGYLLLIYSAASWGRSRRIC